MSDFGKIFEQWEASSDDLKGERQAMSEEWIDRYPPQDAEQRSSIDEPDGQNIRAEQVSIDGEIDLHGYRLEEAIKVTTQFVHESLALGRRKIRVIHGKGENGQGVLRKEIRQLLEKHPRTGQMGYGKGSEGGRGALWIMLRYGS